MDISNSPRIQPIVDAFKRHWALKLYQIPFNISPHDIRTQANTITSLFNANRTNTSWTMGKCDYQAAQLPPAEWQKARPQLMDWSDHEYGPFTFPNSPKIFQKEFEQHLIRRLPIEQLPHLSDAILVDSMQSTPHPLRNAIKARHASLIRFIQTTSLDGIHQFKQFHTLFQLCLPVLHPDLPPSEYSVIWRELHQFTDELRDWLIPPPLPPSDHTLQPLEIDRCQSLIHTRLEISQNPVEHLLLITQNRQLEKRIQAQKIAEQTLSQAAEQLGLIGHIPDPTTGKWPATTRTIIQSTQWLNTLHMTTPSCQAVHQAALDEAISTDCQLQFHYWLTGPRPNLTPILATARPETRDKIIDQLKKRKQQLEETKRTLRQFRLSLTLRLLADQRIDPDQWHDQFLDRTYRADPFDAIIHRAMESPTFRGWSEDLLSSHPIHENDRPMVDQYLRSQLNECSTDLGYYLNKPLPALTYANLLSAYAIAEQLDQLQPLPAESCLEECEQQLRASQAPQAMAMGRVRHHLHCLSQPRRLGKRLQHRYHRYRISYWLSIIHTHISDHVQSPAQRALSAKWHEALALTLHDQLEECSKKQQRALLAAINYWLTDRPRSYISRLWHRTLAARPDNSL